MVFVQKTFSIIATRRRAVSLKLGERL